MNQENYLKEVEKHLNCGKARKKQIRRELEADICAASEQGEEWEETRKRMGDPAELAREFNENMPAQKDSAHLRCRRSGTGGSRGSFILASAQDLSHKRQQHLSGGDGSFRGGRNRGTSE